MIPDDLFKVVSTSFGEAAALELRDYKLTDADLAALKTAVRDVMLAFKPVPGACVMMSALLHFRLKQLSKAPTYFVAGTLQANGVHVYGTAETVVDDKTFTQNNLDWDGHAWVQYGNLIVDAAMRRTVAAGKAPPALGAHVRAKWDGNTGPLCADDIAMRDDGLIYKPLRVLTEAELDPLINGALVTFTPPTS